MKIRTLPPRLSAKPRDGAKPYGWNPKQSRHQAGYGWQWEQKRIQILKRDGYLCKCDDCRDAEYPREANEVDHISAKALGGSEDDANLRAINRECHRRKTAKDRAAVIARGVNGA
jgi:5-methylcytosine-specific restriction protein A